MRALTVLALPLLFACSTETATADPAPAVEATEAPAAEQAPARPGEVDVAGLKAAMDAGPVTLIDVRTQGEWDAGHVPGAQHIPLDDLGGRLAELESKKAEPVYLICAVGGRSAVATKQLSKAGFTQAINVEGGTKAWIASGYPVE